MANNENKPTITITNYVANSRISGFSIDIILKKIPSAEYRPNGFPATVILTKHMRINLYDSGKITSTKSTTEKKATESLYGFVKKLNNIGMNTKLESKPKISMIAAIVDYHCMINIDSLRNNLNYTKDIQSFPAIQLSFPNGVTVKAYDTKLVITAKSINDMKPVIQEIKKYTIRDV